MSLRVRALGVLAISALMVFMAIPSLLPESVRQRHGWLPDSGVQLGLDLQGGIHWLLSVDREQASQRRLEAIAADQREQAESSAQWKVASGAVLQVCGAAPGQLQELAGDARLDAGDGCARFALSEAEQTRELARTADGAMEVIKQRVSNLQEPIITRQGNDRILVQLPGGDIDPERARIGNSSGVFAGGSDKSRSVQAPRLPGSGAAARFRRRRPPYQLSATHQRREIAHHASQTSCRRKLPIPTPVLLGRMPITFVRARSIASLNEAMM